MRLRGAIAIVVLVAVLVAGCGGGSTSTGAAGRGAAGPEEEGIFAVGGAGPPPADGGAPLRGARLRAAEARHVWEGGMVTGDEGWVRSGVGIFSTPDGGQTWRPITPPAPAATGIHGIYFASPLRGWGLYEPGREGDARPSIYRTSDGGRTWHHTRLRAYDKFVMPASKVSFSLVDGHELFALVKASGDTASNFGSLFVSRDSGRHWRALPTPPQAGRIAFETPRRGWLASGRPGPALYRTVDGGRTWANVEPGRPHDLPPPKGGESEGFEEDFGGHEWSAAYSTPLIGPDGHGILGMVESGGYEDAARTVILRTGDYGRTWHRRDRLDLPGMSLESFFEADEVFIRRGRSRSFLVEGPRGAAYVVGPDGLGRPLRPVRGLPRDSTGFTLSDARHGFAFPTFSNRSTLSFTADGGRDWTQVPVPR